MARYIYPKLGPVDLGFVRLSGPGLANCMFMAARAYVEAVSTGAKFVAPTWTKFSIGPLLRGERDKRSYISLFKPRGVRGLKKIWTIVRSSLFHSSDVKVISDIKGYFTPLQEKNELVREYFDSITRPETIQLLDGIDFSDTVAVHVRLGDYVEWRRVSLDWYAGVINYIKSLNPRLKFALFSDGTDEELAPLTSISDVSRHFYGNAYADMVAISRCRLVIASDSTFSAWGAFLGRKPIIFSKRHFDKVYADSDNVPEIVTGETTAITNPEILKILSC